MTLPKKPPLKRDWQTYAAAKRHPACRACGRTDRKIELAHVIGRSHDLKNVSICDWANPRTGDSHLVRVAFVKAERVVPLCGPQNQPGTCHYRHDLGHDLDLWDFLTDEEKDQAIEDAGSLGLALRRCAPCSWDDRSEFVDGELVEVKVDVEHIF